MKQTSSLYLDFSCNGWSNIKGDAGRVGRLFVNILLSGSWERSKGADFVFPHFVKGRDAERR